MTEGAAEALQEDRMQDSPTLGQVPPSEIIEVESVEEFKNPKNEFPAYPLLVVLAEDGREIAWHAFHTVARRELARQRAEAGDRIAVKYFGRTEDGSYERYR